jgi:hypothetical protein
MTTRRRRRGQVLPLFALFVVVLFGFAALAVDVSGAFSARRFYRSAADAASLAGAQDLQQPGNRAVSGTDRRNARQHAMKSLVTELGITGALPGNCTDSGTYDHDITDACILPGTAYHASIRAGVYAGQPAPIVCVSCDAAHSVQVGLRNANYETSFARVLGQRAWSVGITSVAGLAYGRAYAIPTLRPPKANGSGFLINDIEIGGGSVVNVIQGDVGSNANMDYSGGGSILNLDSGYGMYYWDPAPSVGPQWPGAPAPPNQVVQTLPTLMNDPNYVYPAMQGAAGTAACLAPLSGTNCAPTYTDMRTSTCGAPSATAACTSAALDPTGCGVELTYLTTSAYTFMATQPAATTYCYKPGIYDPASSSRNLSVGPADVVLLMPGAYYFKSPNAGVSVSGRILGGYRPSVPGVALMFDECLNSCTFNGNSALTIALNAGNKYPPGTAGTGATAAIDWNNQLVQTSGPSSPTPPVPLTILVTKDPSCFVPTTAPFIEPAGCDPGTHNKTINLAGGGSLDVEGVQYAPTDNIEIHGGAAGFGHVGQIIAWTVFYSGGTHINQEGPANQAPGTLRLDSACTAPGTPCNP